MILSASTVSQKFLEKIWGSFVSRLWGVFSESRKVLPHSMERQLGSRTLLSTAPEDNRLRGGSLPCLAAGP